MRRGKYWPCPRSGRCRFEIHMMRTRAFFESRHSSTVHCCRPSSLRETLHNRHVGDGPRIGSLCPGQQQPCGAYYITRREFIRVKGEEHGTGWKRYTAVRLWAFHGAFIWCFGEGFSIPSVLWRVFFFLIIFCIYTWLPTEVVSPWYKRYKAVDIREEFCIKHLEWLLVSHLWCRAYGQRHTLVIAMALNCDDCFR